MSRIVRICACVVAALIFSPVDLVHAAPYPTFQEAGRQAVATLLHVYYAGHGYWRECDRPSCPRANGDWGVDSATYALFLRWKTAHDPAIARVAAELLAAGRRYRIPCARASCPAWSDTPSWDAVAYMREYEILGRNPEALRRAAEAFHYVVRSKTFVGGACPSIPYQIPQPSNRRVKTLETDANAIKAALLLYEATHDKAYLEEAVWRYAAARRYFLDPQVPLYTVQVVDDGATCRRQDHRFFASVNGDMIWNGLALARITKQRSYARQAIATARAVATTLADECGVFVDLGGENDVVEPLVEGMYDLATSEHLAFAREWIIRNAAAALSARAPDGTFSRFIDGPPQSTASIWQSNGGLALEIAAAALDRDGAFAARGWSDGRSYGLPLTALPATITFEGSGIALIGTIGPTCQGEHVRVFIDGTETFDHTGLWQNYDMPEQSAVRFAWRWPVSGKHTVRLEIADGSVLGNAIELKTIVRA